MNSSNPQVAGWSPPPGFIPLPSEVTGISVYAPAPEEKHEQTQTFKCRFCGGAIAYSTSEGELTCPYCGKSQRIEAEAVGQTAAEYEFTEETLARARYGWGEERVELACEACGSVVAVAPNSLTDTCAFCGSHRVLARNAAGDILRPTALIPFTIDREHLQARVNEWLGRGWMHPSALRGAGGLRELTGVYLPHWTFDTHARAEWRAEVGHLRTERYRQGGEWKTRTTIEWRWQSGSVALPVDDLLIPGTGKVSQVILEKVAPFDLDSLVTYDPGYLAGWQAKIYDVTLPEAWSKAKNQIREQIKGKCYADTGSTHVRSFRMSVDFDEEHWRHVLLPVYLASYKFQDRTFQIMVNGQSGAVAGQKPVEWLRVWLVIAALLAPGITISLIGLLTLVLGIGVLALILGGILFIAGLIGAFFIFQKAQSWEEA